MYFVLKLQLSFKTLFLAHFNLLLVQPIERIGEGEQLVHLGNYPAVPRSREDRTDFSLERAVEITRSELPRHFFVESDGFTFECQQLEEIPENLGSDVVAVQNILYFWLTNILRGSNEAGDLSSNEIKKLLKLQASKPERVLKFLFFLSTEKYIGPIGQLKMSKELGEINLQTTYQLARAFGLIKELQWKSINVQYDLALKFIDEMGNADKYKGNKGQIELAEILGGMNLLQLFTLASNFGYAEKLKWTCMQVPYEKAKIFLDKVRGNTEAYEGNQKQVELACELGGMHLGHLYSLASGLDYAEKLGWNKMNVPCKTATLFLEKMTEWEKYKGNRNQIKMAKELGEVNLGDLYSLASGLAYNERLKWSKMDVSCKTAIEFLKRVEERTTKYKGNEKQIELAGELGRLHVGHLYGLASGLDYIEELGWNKMDVSYRVAIAFKKEMRANLNKYKGNKGQVELSKKLGEVHLTHLYSLASGLGFIEELGWYCMHVTYQKAVQFKTIILERIQYTEINEFYGKAGRFFFAQKYGYHYYGLLGLCDAYSFEDLLGWRSKAIAGSTNGRVLSLDAQRGGDGPRIDNQVGYIVEPTEEMGDRQLVQIIESICHAIHVEKNLKALAEFLEIDVNSERFQKMRIAVLSDPRKFLMLLN